MKIYFWEDSISLIEARVIEASGITISAYAWGYAYWYKVMAWQGGQQIVIIEDDHANRAGYEVVRDLAKAVAANPGREIDFIWIEFPDNVYVRFLDDDK